MKILLMTLFVFFSISVMADKSTTLYENDLVYMDPNSSESMPYPIGLRESTVPLSEHDKFHLGAVVCSSGAANSVETIRLADFYERFRIPIPELKKVYNPIDKKLVSVMSLETEVLFVVGCSN